MLSFLRKVHGLSYYIPSSRIKHVIQRRAPAFPAKKNRIFQKVFLKQPPQAHQILTENISILCEFSAPAIYGNPHTSEPHQALQILT